MRILVVSQYFWPESFRITEVAQALRDAGNDVVVLTGQPNYPDGKVFDGYRATSMRREQHEGITVLRVPLVPRGSGSAIGLVLNYLSFVASAALFGSWLLRGRRVDAILVYGVSPILQAIPAVWLARLKRARLVTWVQDLWPESLSVTGFVRSPRLLAAVSAVVRWIYRRNDLLLAQSKAFVEPVRRLSGGTPVEYFPNPGERAFSSVRGECAPAIVLEPGFNVVFGGYLGTVQALGTVVNAADLLRDMPDVRFVLVGSGSRMDWIRGEIERLHLTNIRMPGRFAADDMPGILGQASALLVSLARSPALSQTVPSKVQAYLAAGRPVIASLDGEGARVLEEAGAGASCPAENAEALAAAVRRLHAMTDEERLAMGRRARTYYELHFDPDLLARRMTDTFEALLRDERPRQPSGHRETTDQELKDRESR